MEDLNIVATVETPDVVFSKKDNLFKIEGMSLPEDVKTFYKPVLEWLSEYSKDPNQCTKMIFKLTYYNTSSSKIILNILNILKEIHRNGKNVEVVWQFREEDEDMIDAGEDYSAATRLPFSFVQF